MLRTSHGICRFSASSFDEARNTAFGVPKAVIEAKCPLTGDWRTALYPECEHCWEKSMGAMLGEPEKPECPGGGPEHRAKLRVIFSPYFLTVKQYMKVYGYGNEFFGQLVDVAAALLHDEYPETEQEQFADIIREELREEAYERQAKSQAIV